MEVVINILAIIWVYGGSYAAALATASSFYAVFFFFWTRTGNRAGRIDMETKKVYLHSIYNVLRFSLYAIILSKIIEVGLIKLETVKYGLDVSVWSIITSANAFFIYTLLLLIAINSFAMQRRWINFSFGLPFAIVSYFFLFIHMTSRNAFSNAEGFLIPAGPTLVTDAFVYLLALIVGTIVFNYFSHKLLGTHKNKSK